MRHTILPVLVAGICIAAVAAEQESRPSDIDTERLEARITPAKPYTLPDKKTVITVKEETTDIGRGQRGGTVQVMVGEDLLDILPPTTIMTNGYRFEFREAPKFVLGETRHEDMIFIVVDSCTLSVRSAKQDAFSISLKKLDETFVVKCSHGTPPPELYTARGEGKHFVSFTPTMVEVSRFHPSQELGARLKMNLVNNFGAKTITLDYKKQKEVTIGKETVTLESFDFDNTAKEIKLRVTTLPATAKAEANILEYGSQPRDSSRVQPVADKPHR